MASRYLMWKYKDVQPDKPRELTAKEKRANWWHYHKWHVFIGIVLVLFLGNIVWSVLGIGKVIPDYQLAYVGSSSLPSDTVSALERAVAQLGTDANGDGQIVVKINQFVSADGSGSENAAMYTYASNVTLMADLSSCDSYFFLLEDPDTFQRNYQVLCRLDGTLPTEFDRDNESCYISWTDCPVLTGMDLGSYSETLLNQTMAGDNQELLSHLYIARRGFWNNKAAKNMDECDALWIKLTNGTV